MKRYKQIKSYKKGGQIEYTSSVSQSIAPTVSQNPTTPGKLDPQEQAAIQRRLQELETSQQMYQRPTDYRTPAEKQYYEQKRITELEKEGLTPEGYPTGRTKVNRTLDPVAGLIEKGIDASVVYEAGLLGAKGLRTLAKKVGSKISIPKVYTGPMMTDLVPFEPVYPTSPYRPPGGRTFPVLPARKPTGMPTLVDVPEFTKEQQILKSFGLDPYKTKVSNNFTSEINWKKWNADIPNNPELLSEYNTIEQSTKNTGTWMKNPDGSVFQGTPEQFVQQNSQNFKKAFPNILKDEAGNVQKTYHGSQDKFEIFDPNITRVGRTRGSGIYTSPIKERAASYANKGEKQLYEFYQNASKPQNIVEQFEKASDKRFKNFLEKNPKKSKDFSKKFEEFIKKEEETFNLTDEDFNLQKGFDFFKASPDEYVVPFTNYPKSAIGNNGMFDMTNPNIYKALVPAVGAAALLQDNKHYGGTINNNSMKTGGFYQKKGMFWDGTKMVKAKGSGTYDGGMYYQQGGQTPTAFWNLPNPTANPGAEGMVDYGSMYSLPNRGLFQKQTAASEWEGFGNPANLIGNQQQQPVAQNYQAAGQPMQYATENKSSFYEGAGENSYSIDDVRKQTMGTGGLYKMGKPRYGAGGIHIDPSKKGTFTAAADKRGQSVQGFASQVLANPGNYSEAMRKKAQFAHNSAGWRKQYGGIQYVVGGVIDPNEGLALPSSNNAWGSSTANTQQQMQEAYAPVQQANAEATQVDANSYANRPVVTQERANMNEQPVDASTLNNPYQAAQQQAPGNIYQQPYRPYRPFGQGFSNFTNAAIAAGGIAGAFKSGREMQQFGIKNGMTNLNPTAGSKGLHNGQGQLMQQFQPPARYGKHGGRMPAPQYKTGGIINAPELGGYFKRKQ